MQRCACMWKHVVLRFQIAETNGFINGQGAEGRGIGWSGKGRLESDLRWWGDVSINTASGFLPLFSVFYSEMNTCWCVPHDIHLSAILPAAFRRGKAIIRAWAGQGYFTKTTLINFGGDCTLMLGFISLTFSSLLSIKVIDETFRGSYCAIKRVNLWW